MTTEEFEQHIMAHHRTVGFQAKFRETFGVDANVVDDYSLALEIGRYRFEHEYTGPLQSGPGEHWSCATPCSHCGATITDDEYVNSKERMADFINKVKRHEANCQGKEKPDPWNLNRWYAHIERRWMKHRSDARDNKQAYKLCWGAIRWCVVRAALAVMMYNGSYKYGGSLDARKLTVQEVLNTLEYLPDES